MGLGGLLEVMLTVMGQAVLPVCCLCPGAAWLASLCLSSPILCSPGGGVLFLHQEPALSHWRGQQYWNPLYIYGESSESHLEPHIVFSLSYLI